MTEKKAYYTLLGARAFMFTVSRMQLATGGSQCTSMSMSLS